MLQPSLTRVTSRLVKDVCARLIERSDRVISLKPAGRTPLVHARKIVAETEEALTATREPAEGQAGSSASAMSGSKHESALSVRLARTNRQFMPASL